MHPVTAPRFNVTQLYGLWKMLKHLPGGKLLFSKLVGRVAPYTGTIDARIVELTSGYARVSLKDRRAVRNHLSSIHALALANFAEVTTGLAMLAGFPPETRGIITNLNIDYLKKARGTLTAECHAPRIETNAAAEHEVCTEIRNTQGEVVARATITWRVGPTR